MLFSSPIFLFLFLPATLIAFFLSPKKYKNLILLLASILFYAWGEKEMVLLILLSTLVDYSAGLIIEKGKRKLGLCLSIVFNVGILLYFKYAYFVYSNLADWLSFLSNEALENKAFGIVLPLGISFYTFQTMSYTIDVYRGQVKASRNIVDFAAYVTLFPQLIAGPIVRYKQIEDQLKSHKVTVEGFSQGVERFIIGLAKKMIIANNCAFFADAAFNLPTDQQSTLIAWLGVFAYSFQIYFDFSGYSDMAIGIGKMLGFNFPENFNFPYISKSIREFWKRWHMTLSNWFKDYLYIPLGGNRKGNLRTYFNLIFVFFVTGLWHGASWTFVVWGFFHGFFLIIERIGFKKMLSKLPNFVSHVYVVLVICISWVFFRSDTLIYALEYINNLFNFNSKTNIEFLDFYLNKEVVIAMFLALFFSTTLGVYLKNFLIRLFKKTSALGFVKYAFLIILFYICCIYVATDSYNPFIYFRF